MDESAIRTEVLTEHLLEKMDSTNQKLDKIIKLLSSPLPDNSYECKHEWSSFIDGTTLPHRICSKCGIYEVIT